MDKSQALFFVLFYLLVMTEGNSEKSEPIFDNFKCVYLFSEKINCTWDVDSKCVNLTFSFGEKNARYEPLERYTCTEPFQARIQCRQIVATTQCYANPKTICLYEHQFYIFSLFGMCRNQAVNETIVIPLNETYVKMKPVKDLKEISSTIDSLTIVWKLVKPQTYYSSSTVICYIEVRSRNQELNITSRSLQSHLYRITIGHLLPGTRYKVKVKCRPRFSVVWSDEYSMYAMTDYTVPLIGPSFISSGFVRVSDAILVYFTVPEGHVSQGNIFRC